MVVVFGTRLMGVTDAVPGVFHVATKFFHIDFLPLFPAGSYIVLERRFRSFRGVEIPLSGKSIAIAWLRAILWIGALFMGGWSFIVYGDEGFSAAFAALFGSFLAAGLIASLCTWHGYTRNASYERASELSSKLGPTAAPAVQRLVDAHFGKVAFAVVPTENEHENADLLELPVATKVAIVDQESPEVVETSEFQNEEDQKHGPKNNKPDKKESNDKLPDIV